MRAVTHWLAGECRNEEWLGAETCGCRQGGARGGTHSCQNDEVILLDVSASYSTLSVLLAVRLVAAMFTQPVPPNGGTRIRHEPA